MKELTVNASMDNFQKANAFVQACAERAGFDADSVNKMLLVTEEIFVNIVNYAYDGGSPGNLTIVCNSKPGGAFELKFIDQGKEFDPLKVTRPDTGAPVENRPIGGLGIFLVKKLVDSMQYQRVGQSNILTVSKNNR